MADKATKPAASYSVKCVHCQAVLKSPAPVPGGKTVKCPKCKQSFTTPGAGPTKAPPAPAAGPLDDDAEMDAAIAKLQGDGKLGAPAAAPPPQPTPAPAPAPAAAGSLDDDDEMAAAIAKLQGDGGLGVSAPAPPPPAPAAKSAPQPAVPDMEIPEIDDDLVAPDEDEDEPEPDAEEDEKPAKKKNRRDDDEDEGDEPRSKKKKRRDDDEEEDEDDEPRSKKKRKRDDDDEAEVDEDFEMEVVDDDEEETSAKKKSKRKEDEEEEDEPRSKKKRKRDDDEEDEDDEPRSKKKRKRDDQEDEDDAPRSRKKGKKKAGSPLMLIGLIGGGILVLLICCGVGIGGFLMFGGAPGPNIVGRWEQRDFFIIPWEFRADGTGKVTAIVVMNFTYRQSGDELTINFTGIQGMPGGGRPKMDGRESFRVRVTLTGDTMRWEELDGNRPASTLHKVN